MHRHRSSPFNYNSNQDYDEMNSPYCAEYVDESNNYDSVNVNQNYSLSNDSEENRSSSIYSSRLNSINCDYISPLFYANSEFNSTNDSIIEVSGLDLNPNLRALNGTIEVTCQKENLSIWAVSPFDSRLSNQFDHQLTSTVKIPKIIMQTWKDHDVPLKWRESPISIRNYMSNWTYILMTDNDNDKFCAEHFPNFLSTFRGFQHNIQRADAIRYMWLYKYGGIYMDMDMVITKPLDDLFHSDADLYLCASGNIGSCITNSFMASKPGCQLWLDMLEHMKNDPPYWAWGKHMNVMNTTGPVALNYVVKEYGYAYLALPSKQIMPCSVCNLDRCNTDNSYIRPLPGSSWVAWDTRLYNFFLCNWKPIIIFIVLFIILLIVYSVFKSKRYV